MFIRFKLHQSKFTRKIVIVNTHASLMFQTPVEKIYTE